MSQKPPLGTAALMRWYLDAGVDEAIGEHPVNRYRNPADRPEHPRALATAPVNREQKAPQPRPHPQHTTPVGSAAAIASQSSTLDELRNALLNFHECPLSKTATNLVFGDGDPEARIVLIGEAPGAEEDRRGLPFVGPSGRLLDRMLASIGLDRSTVFISNIVYWRPPGNRNPTASEVAICMPFVERMLELKDPDILVALGGPAASALLGQKEGIGKLRGRWFTYQTPRLARPIPARTIFHPAYLLRSPAQKRLAWRDLIALKNKIEIL
jgi:DNA polymerase